MPQAKVVETMRVYETDVNAVCIPCSDFQEYFLNIVHVTITFSCI